MVAPTICLKNKTLTNCLSKIRQYQTLFFIALAFIVHSYKAVIENGRLNCFCALAEQRDNVGATYGRPQNVNLSQKGRPIVTRTNCQNKIFTNCLSKNGHYQTLFVIALAFNVHSHNDVAENGRTNNFASFAEQRDNVWAIGGRPRNVNLSQNGRPIVTRTNCQNKILTNCLSTNRAITNNVCHCACL